MECVNKDESLFDLVQKEQRLKRELVEVRNKIKTLETTAKNGTGAIRLM